MRHVREIHPFGKVLPQQPVGIFIRATLPGLVWIAEVDLDIRGEREVSVLGHFAATIPRQRPVQLLRQATGAFDQCVDHRLAVLVGHLHQDHIACLPLDQRGDLAVLVAKHQIAFPVTWHRPISRISRSLADRHRVFDAAVVPRLLGMVSLQPAMLGSFASFSTGQNKKAEDLATAGLQANPGTVGLYNNRAVARALLGRPTEAIEDIREGLRPGGSDDPYLIATLGMVAYRSGDYALGATCYGTAIADFVTAKDKSTLAYGILMWLRERAAAGDALIGEEYARLKPHLVAVTMFSKEPEVETMIELLESDLRTAVLPNVVRAGVSSDELQQTFAQFKPDRRVISLRDSIFEDL